MSGYFSKKSAFRSTYFNSFLLYSFFSFIGEYHLDPNGGSKWDEFSATCDFEMEKKETCIYPTKATFEKKKWVPNTSTDSWQWFLRDLAVDEEVKETFKKSNEVSSLLH